MLVNFSNSPFGGAKGKEDKGSGKMNRGWVHYTLCDALRDVAKRVAVPGCR